MDKVISSALRTQGALEALASRRTLLRGAAAACAGLAISGLETPASVRAGSGTILTFETMAAVSGPFVGATNPIRGLKGGGLPRRQTHTAHHGDPCPLVLSFCLEAKEGES